MKTRQKVAAAAEPVSKKPVLVQVHKPVEGFEELNRKAAKKAAKKKTADAAELETAPEPADDEEKPRGGYRPGAGRPAYLKPSERKKQAAYMSATDREKAMLTKKAEKLGLTLSYYMRKCCGLSINPPA